VAEGATAAASNPDFSSSLVRPGGACLTGPFFSCMKFCDEKNKLIRRYEAATNAYASSIRELQQGLARLARFDYERSFLATEEARYTSELARAALLTHIRQHHC